MKFRVIGSHKDTGARMVLEIQAESKAAAERKAMQGGMHVTRVEDADLVRETYDSGRPASRRAPRRDFSTAIKLVVILGAAAAAWYYWPQLREMVGK